MQFSLRFKQLCKEKGVTQKQALADMRMGRNSAQSWISGRPSLETLQKIADYFDMTTDEVLGTETKKAPDLTAKDERDIARNLEAIMADLEHSGDLMFDGDPMSDEARASMRNAIELGLRAVKQLNKETYTPKKYRKG